MAVRKHTSKAGTITWQARFRDDRDRQQTRTFKTRRGAELFTAAVTTDKRRGEFVSPQRGRATLGRVAGDWLASRVDLRDSTRSRYDSALRTHVLPTFGSVAVGRIERGAVERWVRSLLDSGMAPASVAKAHQVLSLALGHAVSAGHVRMNPAAGVKVPSTSRQEMLVLTLGQVRALAAEMPPGLDLLVRFAALTGLRAGETHALRRRDVDLVRRVVVVARSGDTHGDPYVEVGETKSGHVRTVSLPDFLIGELRDHLRARPIQPDALLFVMPEGGGVRHSNLVRRHFKPAVHAALPPELHDLRWHDLRHTAAALAIQAGAHPKIIQARLGHSTIRTTLDIYGHLLPGLDDALAVGLDAAWRATESELGGNAEVTGISTNP